MLRLSDCLVALMRGACFAAAKQIERPSAVAAWKSGGFRLGVGFHRTPYWAARARVHTIRSGSRTRPPENTVRSSHLVKEEEGRTRALQATVPASERI